MEKAESTEKMKVEILVAAPEDALGIKEVQYETWLATYPNQELGITPDDIKDRFRDAFTDESITKTQERIRSEKGNTRSFVAKANGQTVGFCFCSKSDTKNHLDAIYVLSEFQGKGIGRKFWERALAFFDPEKDIVVELAEYNSSAIAFYESLGFVDTGERKKDERLTLKSGAIIPEMVMIIKRSGNVPDGEA